MIGEIGMVCGTWKICSIESGKRGKITVICTLCGKEKQIKKGSVGLLGTCECMELRPKIPSTQLKKNIIAYITNHPGCVFRDICINLGSRPSQTKSMIMRLVHDERIYCKRESKGISMNWYPYTPKGGNL